MPAVSDLKRSIDNTYIGVSLAVILSIVIVYEAMNVLIEPLIIFMVLYFPGLCFSLMNLSWESAPVYSFNAQEELFWIITHNIPALCLIWYFLLKEPLRSVLGRLKPDKKDFFQTVKIIIGLIVIGFAMSGLMNLVLGTHTEGIHIPGLLSWMIITVNCVSTGYMEESYFRVYLLNRLTLSGISQNKALVSSCLLFAVCHVYQGPAGLLTSFLAGLFLSHEYIKKRSVHAIALGHGLYNLVSLVIAYMYSILHQ